MRQKLILSLLSIQLAVASFGQANDSVRLFIDSALNIMAIYKEIAGYNFNDVGFALIRNDVKNRL